MRLSASGLVQKENRWILYFFAYHGSSPVCKLRRLELSLLLLILYTVIRDCKQGKRFCPVMVLATCLAEGDSHYPVIKDQEQESRGAAPEAGRSPRTTRYPANCSGPPRVFKSEEEVSAMREPGVRKSVEKKRPEERLRRVGHQANDGQIQWALAMEANFLFGRSRLRSRCCQ